MDDWILSAEALETKSHMLNKEFSVYVEGKDDILFWESLFHKSGLQNFHIEEVGGYEFLKPYIDRIIHEDANIIVACDSHYMEFTDELVKHDRIIRTYGYSIENTMYNSLRINLIIKKYCLMQVDLKEEIENWMSEFSDQLSELLKYHIANVKYRKTTPILRDKCIEYLTSKTTPNLCSAKIQKKLSEVATVFNHEEISVVERKIEEIQKPTWHLIKGHFLTNAVLNYIKKQIKLLKRKAIPITLETLYAHCVNMNEFNTDNLDDVKYKLDMIKLALASNKSHSD